MGVSVSVSHILTTLNILPPSAAQIKLQSDSNQQLSSRCICTIRFLTSPCLAVSVSASVFNAMFRETNRKKLRRSRGNNFDQILCKSAARHSLQHVGNETAAELSNLCKLPTWGQEILRCGFSKLNSDLSVLSRT